MDANPGSDEVSGIPLLYKGDQRFANLTAEGPEFVRISRANQGADLDRTLLGVSDDQGFDSPVPSWMRVNVSEEFLPEFFDRQMIVEIEKDRPEQFRRAACPIFKGLFQEVSDRDNQTSLIP